MKITYIEIEADAEDMRATKNLSETLTDALTRVFGNIGTLGYSDVCERVSEEDEADTL